MVAWVGPAEAAARAAGRVANSPGTYIRVEPCVSYFQPGFAGMLPWECQCSARCCRCRGLPAQGGKMHEIRALLFDVFGTVVDWRNGVAGQVAPFLERHGSAASPAAFADAWRRRYQPGMEAVRSGRRPFVPLDTLHRENLEAILPEAGLDPAAIPPAELDALTLAWHRLDPWPDVLPGLARLKKQYIIAPLSNGNIILMLDIARRAGIPWDTILGAEVVRAYKPDPRAYDRTVALLALRPEQVCMVAAHNSDLAAARRSGLRTAFVARPTEHGPGQTTDLAPEQDWDFVAGDFLALADALGAAC